MATLALRLDRVKGIANVISQDRIYIRDEAVAVTIEGFENGEESLAPCLQILHGRCVVAEAMITVTPSNDGAVATATLNTNTRQFVDVFRGCVGETMHQFQLRIFSTTSQKPIAVGVCSVWNFTAGEGEPSNLPSASEVLSELREDLNEEKQTRAEADTQLSNAISEMAQQFAAFKTKFDFSTISELTDADSLRAVKNAFNNLLQKLKAVNV